MASNAKFEVDDIRAHQCDYGITLSNEFNTTYYRELKIITKERGFEKRYMTEYAKAPSSRDRLEVTGVIKNLRPNTNYHFYAEAMAKNGNWYPVGEFYIKTKKVQVVDLRISKIECRKYLGSRKYSDYKEVDEKLVLEKDAKYQFRVYVKNYDNAKDMPRYEVILRDYYDDDDKIDRDYETKGVDARDTNRSKLVIDKVDSDIRKLKFEVISRDDDWELEDKVEVDVRVDVVKEIPNGLSIEFIQAPTNMFIDEYNDLTISIKNKGIDTSETCTLKITEGGIEGLEEVDNHSRVIDTIDIKPIEVGESDEFTCRVKMNMPGCHHLGFEIYDGSKRIAYKIDNIIWYDKMSIMKRAKAIAEIFEEVKKDINILAELNSIKSGNDFTDRVSEIVLDIAAHIVNKGLLGEKYAFGLVFDCGVSFVVGLNGGLGFYTDQKETVIAAKFASGGVELTEKLFASQGNIGAAAKLVVFPWADSVDTLEGLGATVSVGLGNFDASITNLDMRTLCLGYEICSTPGGSSFSLGFDFGGFIDSDKAQFKEPEKNRDAFDDIDLKDVYAIG